MTDQVTNPIEQSIGEISSPIFGGPELIWDEVQVVKVPGLNLTSGPQKGVMNLPVSRDLTARKLYFMVRTQDAQAIGYDAYLLASAKFYIGNTIVGSLPLNFLSGGATPSNYNNKSYPCIGVTSSSGSVGQDGLFVSLTNLQPWEGTLPLSTVIYPTHFRGVFDRCQIDIDGIYNVRGARMFAAIQSNTELLYGNGQRGS